MPSPWLPKPRKIPKEKRKPGRPPSKATPELKRFADEYLKNGGNAMQAAKLVWGPKKGDNYRTRAVRRAKRLGLIPLDFGKQNIKKEVGQPLDSTEHTGLVDPTFVTRPPLLPPGKSYARLSTLSDQELLDRITFIANASVTPFFRFDFNRDKPAVYKTVKKVNQDTGQEEEVEELVREAVVAPPEVAEEWDGSRGVWTAALDGHSMALALRAGYGVSVKEVSYDTNGRLKLKLHDALAAQALLAKLKGMDKSVKQHISIEQLNVVSGLSIEEQRKRALAAIAGRQAGVANLRESIPKTLQEGEETAEPVTEPEEPGQVLPPQDDEG